MAPDSPLDWTDDGQPRSRLYGDVYYSAQDGLAETRAVFFEGCGLPDAWRGRRRFVVGELGFGVGLNALALIDLWRRTRPAAGQLHIFSIEAHPVAAGEAARALERWPELTDLARRLTDAWPLGARGVHRLEFADLGVILDVAVADVVAALTGWRGRADAWFLDGFSPALNPAMWTDEVLGLVGARAAAGARAATYTVAGQVRRGLQSAGFATEKRPGFGRKRERLEARYPGEPADQPGARRIAIVGGGIAGASAARAVRDLGGEPLVIEAEGLGARASGNPAALVTPRLDAGLGVGAELFAQAFGRAVQLYAETPEAIIAQGVLQLAGAPRDAERFAKIAGSGLFAAGALEPIDVDGVSARLGEPASAGLDQPAALVIEPQALLDAWIGQPLVAQVAVIARDGDDWRLLAVDGREIARADAVIVAAGVDSGSLLALPPMQPVRGQASWTILDAPPPAVAWGGYAVPTRTGVLFGATHDRDDAGLDVRDADHQRNLATLAQRLPTLAARVEGRPMAGRAAVRATTVDRLPLAGLIAGVGVLTGFGSRGFSFAPLLAEHVVALVMGAPSPLSERLAALVDPHRAGARRKPTTTA